MINTTASDDAVVFLLLYYFFFLNTDTTLLTSLCNGSKASTQHINRCVVSTLKGDVSIDKEYIFVIFCLYNNNLLLSCSFRRKNYEEKSIIFNSRNCDGVLSFRHTRFCN